MKKHYNITVTGKVQGVGFRYNTMYSAKKMKITGFVKNQTNGSVYIEAEAEQEVLDQFIEHCKTGPSSANVRKVTFSESNLVNFKSFEIRYYS